MTSKYFYKSAQKDGLGSGLYFNLNSCEDF